MIISEIPYFQRQNICVLIRSRIQFIVILIFRGYKKIKKAHCQHYLCIMYKYCEGGVKVLKLEPFTRADFQALMDWIPDAFFAFQWGGPSFTYPLTVEQLENYLKNSNTENASKYIFKAVDKSTGKTIGHISLSNVDRVNDSARIGKVLIGPSESRGNGYGTQLILEALKFAFDELKLHKVTLGVFDFNTSAIKCYEKVGFKKEGLLRDARKHGGKYWNLIEMGILEDEWKALILHRT